MSAGGVPPGGAAGAGASPGGVGSAAAAAAAAPLHYPAGAVAGVHSPQFSTHSLLDTVLDGKYRVTRFLSNVTGAYGFPYQGTELSTGQPVFIKVLKSARDGNTYSSQRELDSVRCAPAGGRCAAGMQSRPRHKGAWARAARRLGARGVPRRAGRLQTAPLVAGFACPAAGATQ